MGEGAIDHGGPRREFFRLFAAKTAETYFSGGTKAYFTCNVPALQVKHTYMCIVSVITTISCFCIEAGVFLPGPVHCYVSCAGRLWVAVPCRPCV